MPGTDGIVLLDKNGRRYDPLRGFKYVVSSQPIGIKCGFSKITGLESEIDIAEYRDGCDTITPRKIPGMARFPNVTMEGALSQDESLVAWHDEVVKSSRSGGIASTAAPAPSGLGSQFRRTIFIQLFDGITDTVAKEWRLLHAWPYKLNDGDLDASSSDVIIQTVEFCHEGLVRSGNATAEQLTGSAVNGVGANIAGGSLS